MSLEGPESYRVFSSEAHSFFSIPIHQVHYQLIDEGWVLSKQNDRKEKTAI